MNTAIIRVKEEDKEKAKGIIYGYPDKDFSLVDTLSFMVMNRLSITDVFTFDDHFAQYGLNVIKNGRR